MVSGSHHIPEAVCEAECGEEQAAVAGHGEGRGGAELTEGPRGPGVWGWCSLEPAFLQPRLPTGPPVAPAEPRGPGGPGPSAPSLPELI